MQDIPIMPVIAIIIVAVVIASIMIRQRYSADAGVHDLPPAPPNRPAPPANMAEIEQRARPWLAQGNKIQAIKEVREATGWGLKEAKDYVDELEKGSPAGAAPAPRPAAPARGGFEAAQDALARGNKIQAIKEVREATGWGLKESKDYVDEWERSGHRPAAPASEAPSAPPATGDVEQVARAMIAQGNIIGAIKEVREATGWGLKEAKDYVEGLR